MDVVVLGGGESGLGAARLAQAKGLKVFLSDAGTLPSDTRSVLSNLEIDFEEKQHNTEKVLSADLIVKSPGIPNEAAIVREAKKRGIPVIGEIEFAHRYSNSKTIGITGSNGKTTTTLLTRYILSAAGIDVAMAGNVGKSYAGLLADGLSPEWFVLELSSFQLDDIETYRPDVAMVLNITPDHLDRYNHDVWQYAASKMRITMNQTSSDWLIVSGDDPITAEMLNRVRTKAQMARFAIKDKEPETNEHGLMAYATNDKLIINPNNPLTMTIQELALQGKHNVYNSMASAIAARILEVRKEVIRECLSDFQNIEHRLEFVNKVYGISFINDSKATNVNSAWYALESMSEPVIWIAGGVDKGNDYSQIKDMVRQKVKAIVCLGKDNSKLIEAFSDVVDVMVETDNMRDAVYAAYKLGDKGDVVLLSPACASFDLFQDYEDRGRQFKEAVRNL